MHHKWQWCMVPEIWNATDRVFCHSGPFFALLPPYGPRKSKFWKNEQHTWWYYHFINGYDKWQSYDVWFLRYEMQQTEIFVILDHFCPFNPPPKNQNFEKLKNMPGDVIILHLCTTNDNHMMYSYWNMKHDRQNFLLFWTVFSFLPT